MGLQVLYMHSLKRLKNPELVNDLGFLGGSDGKKPSCNAGDRGLIPGLGRSPGGGYGNPVQYSCLENPHGQRSLWLWHHKKSDMIEQLSTAHDITHFFKIFLKLH